MTCCFDCRYFQPEGMKSGAELTEEDWNGGACEGECRRRDPRPGRPIRRDDGSEERDFGVFPRMMGDDWCGKFRPRRR